jgi:hypothetical protein
VTNSFAPVFKKLYRNIFLSHWNPSLHIMFYSLSEKTNTINLLLKNNNNNKYCKWGHFVGSPDFNSVQ